MDVNLKAGKRYWFPTVILSGQDETADWDDNVNKVKNGLLTGEIDERGRMCVVADGDVHWWIKPEHLFERDKRSAHKNKRR